MNNIFVIITLHDTVEISASELNSNIDNHVKNALVRKIEKTTINSGFVNEIYDIEIHDARKRAESLNSNITIDLSYKAQVCNVQPNLYIAGTITDIVSGTVKSKNGPLICATKIQNINNNAFEIGANGKIYHKQTGKQLAKGQNVKLLVTEVRSIINLSYYGVIGNIVDLLDEEDAKYIHRDRATANRNVSKNVEVNEDEYE